MSGAEAQVWPAESQVLTGDRIALGEQKLNIVKCAACDNRHDAIEMKEYARPPVPFTHYYICPNLGDPVPVALAMLKNGEGMELSGPVCNELAKAQLAGRYLVVVCRNNDGVLTLSVHQQKFATGDYFPSVHEGKPSKGVMGMLKELLEQEAGVTEQAAMKRAEVPKPIRDLFGAAGPGADKRQYQLPREAIDQMRASADAAAVPASSSDLQASEAQE